MVEANPPHSSPPGAAAPPDAAGPAQGNPSVGGDGARRGVDTLFVSLLQLSRLFGQPVSEADVRATCPIPETGMTVAVFAHAAERLGYRVQRVPFTLRDAARLPTPCVLLGRPKVGALLVTAINDQTATLYSAAENRVVAMRLDQLANLASEALLVAPIDAEEKGMGWRGMIAQRIRSVLWELVLASLIINLIGLVSPLFVMTVYNKVIGQRALDTLTVLTVGIATLYLFDFAMRGIRGYVSSHTGARMDALLGGEVIHRLVHLPYGHFETTPTGLISERLRQLETIRQFFTGQMPMVMVDLAFVVVFLGTLYYLSPIMALVVLAAIPVFVGVSLLFHRAQKKLVDENFTALAAKTSTLAETVANSLTVKSLGLESEIERRWGGRLAMSAWAGFKTHNLANLTSVIGNSLQQFAGLLIIVLGARLVIAGEMSIGALIAANILASRALAPMRQVVGAWSQLQEVRAAFDRLDEIMDVPTEAQVGERQAAGTIEGSITFENVSFAYEGSGVPVISNLNLQIPKGAIVCIMGASGSGKSTIAKLMQGLYQPDEGRILIDGGDIAHVTPNSIRRQMGVAPQENQLFAGTIRENIVMGVSGISHGRMINVANFTGANDFIQRLPKGYDTVLNERGGGLSAGQRQLICITRALCRNPRIIIMDEPTSSLDSVTEERLLANLRRLGGDRTLVIISHRMAPATIADKVVVISDGRMVAEGPPGEIAQRLRDSVARTRPQAQEIAPPPETAAPPPNTPPEPPSVPPETSVPPAPPPTHPAAPQPEPAASGIPGQYPANPATPEGPQAAPPTAAQPQPTAPYPAASPAANPAAEPAGAAPPLGPPGPRPGAPDPE